MQTLLPSNMVGVVAKVVAMAICANNCRHANRLGNKDGVSVAKDSYAPIAMDVSKLDKVRVQVTAMGCAKATWLQRVLIGNIR